MKKTINIHINRSLRSRQERRRLGFVLFFMAILVALSVYWYFRVDAISLGNETNTEEPTGTEELTGTEEPTGTITLTSTSYTDLSSITDVTITWALNDDAYYDAEDSYIHVPLIVNFTGLSGQTIIDNGYTFTLALPDGVVPATELESWYKSAVGSSIEFEYMFVEDGSGNYYMVIKFDSDDVDAATTYDGYLSFEAVYSDTDENDQIVIEYNGSQEIIIKAEEITVDENESWDADITVNKTSGNYNVSTNSITYTVTVYSEKGTDGKEITLSDLLSVSGSGLTDEDIESITIDSVQSATMYYYENKTKSYEWTETGNEWTDVSAAATVSENGYTITLPAISSTTAEDTSSGDTIVTTTSTVYQITYTVTFDPESTELAATLKNTATASVEEEGISDTATCSKYVSTSVVDKSGTYSSTEQTITWTITVNPYGSDIAGYIFYDNMFAEANAGTLVVTNTGTGSVAVEGTDWQYVYDSTDTTIIGIQFLGDSNGNNTASYTITYTTSVDISLGESPTITNEVTVTDGESPETEIASDSTSVGTETKGSLTKELTDVDDEKTNAGISTRSLTWKSVITVPDGGISAGTEIYDYLGTYSGDTWSYTSGAGSTYQWFTYDQITYFFGGLTTSGITVTDESNNTSTIAESSFTLYAYDATTGEWVSYSALTDYASTYSAHVFTAYKIVFDTAADVSGDIELTYTTTANTTNVTTDRTYWNSIKTGNLSAAASYTEYNPVYKADGNGVTGTTTHATTDGTVTWKVYVYVDSSTTGDIVIKDTLPSGVSLTSATVAYQTTNISSITCDANTWSATNDVTVSVDDNVSTITIPYSVYSTYAASGAGYMIVTYTCKIDDFSNYENTQSYTWSGLKNSATVTIGSSETTVDQTQNITYTYSTGTPTDETVAKNYTYDSNNNILDFFVIINPDAEDLVSGSDTLDFTDVLTANVAEDYTWGWVVSLRSSSVKFYELVELTVINGIYYYTTGTTVSGTAIYEQLTDYSSSDIYTADDGTIYYKKLLDIAWTYSEDYTYYSGQYTSAVHTISATIPDSTAVYVEYSYSILKGYENKFSTALHNTASVSGSHSDSVQPNDDYTESTTSGSVSSTGSLTIIKVDGSNFSTTLANATFELYKYVGTGVQGADDEGFISTGQTFTTNSNGTFTITMENSSLSVNTLYYLVESAAPDGYILDTSSRYYFYWLDEDAVSPAYSDFPTSTVLQIIGNNFYAVLSDYSATAYPKNYASTTTKLYVVKRDSTDDDGEDTRISGATYTLQQYTGSDWEDVKDSSGNVITYTTNKNGRITVSLSDYSVFTYNQAYRLVETAYPDGYEAVSGTDQSVIYFWWSYDDTTAYAVSVPSDWTASSTNNGASTATAIDLADSSVTAGVTNTPIPTTSVTVNKEWTQTENGTTTNVTASMSSSACAYVQLYYYLGDTITVDTGGTGSETVTVYFGGASAYGSSLNTVQTNVENDAYTYFNIPKNQTVTITVEITKKGAYDYISIAAYKYTEQYGGTWYAGESVSQKNSYNSDDYLVYTYIYEFDTSDTTALLYQITESDSSNTISNRNITISYTDTTSSTTYTYEYTDGSGWTQTSPSGTGGGSAGTGSTDVSYSELTGVTDQTGVLYSDTVYTLSAANNWSVTLEDLPKYIYTTDTNGDLVKQYYYYYFVETDATGKTVDGNGVITSATYSQADGIPGTTDATDDDPDENETESRVITITNSIEEISEEYELPGTGGRGRKPYVFAAILILLTLLGIATNKKYLKN